MTLNEEMLFTAARWYGRWAVLAENLIDQYQIIERLRAGEDLGAEWWVVRHAFTRARFALSQREDFETWLEFAREEWQRNKREEAA